MPSVLRPLAQLSSRRSDTTALARSARPRLRAGRELPHEKLAARRGALSAARQLPCTGPSLARTSFCGAAPPEAVALAALASLPVCHRRRPRQLRPVQPKLHPFHPIPSHPIPTPTPIQSDARSHPPADGPPPASRSDRGGFYEWVLGRVRPWAACPPWPRGAATPAPDSAPPL
eukprot:scaffold2266_cov313-Prasinococcus_capsulatus_cf.AAC.1